MKVSGTPLDRSETSQRLGRDFFQRNAAFARGDPKATIMKRRYSIRSCSSASLRSSSCMVRWVVLMFAWPSSRRAYSTQP